MRDPLLGVNPFDLLPVVLALWGLGVVCVGVGLAAGWERWHEARRARQVREAAAREQEREAQQAREIAALKALGEAYSVHVARRQAGRRVFESRGKP